MSVVTEVSPDHYIGGERVDPPLQVAGPPTVTDGVGVRRSLDSWPVTHG